MEPATLKKVIFGLVGVWVIAGGVLAILVFTDVISKALFEKMFVIGFVVFAIVAGLLSKVLSEQIQADSEDN